LPNISPNDCEDLEVGFDSISGVSSIYLADIGDNNGKFKSHIIYKIPEPTVLGGIIPTKMTAAGIEKLVFHYPNNEKWNAETLLFDPISQDFLILTKNKSAGILFRFPFPQNPANTTTLERLTVLPIDLATAGDISPNGTEILLKNKQDIFYWKAKNGEKPAELLKNIDPERVPYIAETQGEAVCFNRWATGFFTTSEIANAASQPIFFYLKH
jgi:hypothetical protein